jgi:5-hydroxyisourate hydrolase/2-oxo-4-hydroxy-4-carboxy-5-ureidoimidazoline decarboxylase
MLGKKVFRDAHLQACGNVSTFGSLNLSFAARTMHLQAFNHAYPSQLLQQLTLCCGATRWAETLSQQAPFASEETLVRAAEEAWYNTCDEADWRAAFAHHPRIGDVESLTKKFADTRHWAGKEQSGVEGAAHELIHALAEANRDYEARFGYIFIICATGKSAAEMLRLLQDRLSNTPEEEMRVAMGEQHKITLIRLQKLLSGADWSFLKNSAITTHVLDTSAGRPANNLTIRLQNKDVQGRWATFCQGVTNGDGRIPDLLPPHRPLPFGLYNMVFETGPYLQARQETVFYPCVEVQFQVADTRHHHIPLLLNPYGYATYRGS